MARAPDWTREEFEILLENPQLTDEERSTHLPRRTVKAIQIVRSIIHGFHRRNDVSCLSKIMLQTLDERRGTNTCPQCRAIF
jgi:hypothetical protein